MPGGGDESTGQMPAIHNESIPRVPNRFFRIRDLAYFKAGIRDLEGRGVEIRDLEGRVVEIRDCDHGRDTGFGYFKERESGNVALNKPRFGNSRD